MGRRLRGKRDRWAGEVAQGWVFSRLQHYQRGPVFSPLCVPRRHLGRRYTRRARGTSAIRPGSRATSTSGKATHTVQTTHLEHLCYFVYSKAVQSRLEMVQNRSTSLRGRHQRLLVFPVHQTLRTNNLSKSRKSQPKYCPRRHGGRGHEAIRSISSPHTTFARVSYRLNGRCAASSGPSNR